MSLAQRTSVLHHLCTRADEIREGIDPNLLPTADNTDGWTARLVASLGCAACGDEEGVAEYHLIDHGAMLLLWLEALVAEAAR